MKIISLNTWAGKAGREKMLDFFTSHADEVDVFCLQEVFLETPTSFEGEKAGGNALKREEIMTRGVDDISSVLPQHTPFFHSHLKGCFGLMMLARKDIDIVEDGEVFVYKHKDYAPKDDLGNHARNIQYVTVKHNGGLLSIVNFHGLWNGKGKGDTKDRIAQSENILAFVKELNNPFVLLGDFNLLPDTKSLKVLEDVGLRNLITEYGITSTRTRLYQKPEKHADYVFVSDGVVVNDFTVLPDEVSDHAPLLVDIE